MNINQLVANRIKEIRNDKGITSQAMADDLGITIGSYSAIENGKVNITLERLHQIAHVFKMPLLAFLPQARLPTRSMLVMESMPLTQLHIKIIETRKL